MKNYQKYHENKKRLRDADYMGVVLDVAGHARSSGDVPVAAVLAWLGGTTVTEHDTRYSDRNPLCHAVMNVLNKAAGTLGRKSLREAVLYTNVEPCTMCALAIEAAGVREVVFGAFDDRDGFISSRLLTDHTLLNVTAVGGVEGIWCCESLPESMHEHVRHE